MITRDTILGGSNGIITHRQGSAGKRINRGRTQGSRAERKHHLYEKRSREKIFGVFAVLMICITCQGADKKSISELEDFQGTLKKLDPKNAEKLEKSIRKYGFTAPFFVWGNKLLDGHQRLKVLKTRFKPEEYPENGFPVVYVDAEDEYQAREKLLHITSQYGELDVEELEAWISDIDADIAETLRLVDGEVALGSKDLAMSDFDEATDDDKPGTVCPKCGFEW